MYIYIYIYIHTYVNQGEGFGVSQKYKSIACLRPDGARKEKENMGCGLPDFELSPITSEAQKCPQGEVRCP